MSVRTLFEYIKQDYELKCNLALAQFLGISVAHIIQFYRGNTLSEDAIQTILTKTDLTLDEINEAISSP